MFTALKMKISPYQRAKKILTAQTLDEAIRGADTYVKNKVILGPQLAGYALTAVCDRPVFKYVLF